MGRTTQLGAAEFEPLRRGRRRPQRKGAEVYDLPQEAPMGRGSLSKSEKIAVSVAAMCAGKPVYATASEAFRTVKLRNQRVRVARHKKRPLPVLEPYRCPHCGQWHIGG
jgi:hypothetical protein